MHHRVVGEAKGDVRKGPGIGKHHSSYCYVVFIMAGGGVEILAVCVWWVVGGVLWLGVVWKFLLCVCGGGCWMCDGVRDVGMDEPGRHESERTGAGQRWFWSLSQTWGRCGCGGTDVVFAGTGMGLGDHTGPVGRRRPSGAGLDDRVAMGLWTGMGQS